MSDAAALHGHRPPGEVTTRDLLPLTDPQLDSARTRPNHAQWMGPAVIHPRPGRVPPGNRPTGPRGAWGGWLRPRHGGPYDTSGRVRHGLVPANLAVPTGAFDTDSKIKIG